MPNFLERYRHLSLLVAVLLAQLFFLAFQIKTQNEARLIRVWAAAAVSPVQRLLHWTVDSVDGLMNDYLLLYGVQQENRELQADLETARIRLQELEARAAETDRLARLLDLRESYASAPLVAAEVIGASPTGAVRTVMLNQGENSGLRTGMAVMTPDGIVGNLVTVHLSTSVVLLVTDQKSGVGVVTSDSRVHGVLKGNGSQLCDMAYVPNEEEVRPGQLLLTSGQDQLFPKGLAVGRILSAERGNPDSNDFFWTIEVEPAAKLSRLDEVLILAGPPESLSALSRKDMGVKARQEPSAAVE